MTQLPPELVPLIEHARDGHNPDPHAKARVRAALATSIVAGAAVATTTTTAKGLSPVVLGLLLAGGGAAVVGVAAVTLDWGAAPALTKTAPAAAPHPAADHATPDHATSDHEAASAVAPTISTTPSTPAIAEVPATPRHEARHTRAAHRVPQPVEDPVSTLASELELVRSATAAINEQRWAQAIEWLDQHASRFPKGALAQERSGLRALSICKLGRADGKDAAARFIRAYPDSPMIERLRASCAGLP